MDYWPLAGVGIIAAIGWSQVNWVQISDQVLTFLAEWRNNAQRTKCPLGKCHLVHQAKTGDDFICFQTEAPTEDLEVLFALMQKHPDHHFLLKPDAPEKMPLYLQKVPESLDWLRAKLRHPLTTELELDLESWNALWTRPTPRMDKYRRYLTHQMRHYHDRDEETPTIYHMLRIMCPVGGYFLKTQTQSKLEFKLEDELGLGIDDDDHHWPVA